MSHGSHPADEYQRIQQMIYTRWVNQKLGARQLPTLTDILADIGKDEHLSNLIAALSGTEMKKKKGKCIVKAQWLDWISQQLDFVFASGVEIKLKPSADNIYDGDSRDIMGLVYAVMLKFMKFDDEDGESAGNARDALLRWCQFHTKGFEGVNVVNLTKSWQDGLALCALVNKFRPDAIAFESLDRDNAVGNLKIAMDAAARHFKVAQFLTPEELLALTRNPDGDKAMLVVISEYYYGINEFFKRQLAGKRITKVVVFTRDNDESRVKYADEGVKLLARLDTSETLLSDIETVDNTMAGAKKRLEDFGTYMQSQKKTIITTQMEMMGNFDTLSLRLSNNNRPAFTPTDPTIAPDALKSRIAALSAKEAVEPKLHAELGRQTRLVHLHAQHTTEAVKLVAWIAEKHAMLMEPVTSVSSGDARKQIKLFESFKKAVEAKKVGAFALLKSQSESLESESYESLADARGRETTIQSGFGDIDAQSALNEPILKDNLAREIFKEDVLMKVDVHGDINDNLMLWGFKKTTYLEKKESVSSVQEARLQLSTLDAADKEIEDTKGGNFARLKVLGGEIRSAKYASDHSEWVHPSPEDIEGLEDAVNLSFESELAPKSVAKRAILDDHLAREQVKEKVKNWADSHERKHADIAAWGVKNKEYLETEVPVISSAEATYQISVLEAYTEARSTFEAGDIASLFELGRAIRQEKYETEHSTWVYPDPDAVESLESQVTELLGSLTTASDYKKEVLDDDLARELYIEETNLLSGQHTDKATQCAGWANEKAAYLQENVTVHSMREARVGLNVLDAYNMEKARFTASAVTSMKELGELILDRKYETAHSNYKFDNPDELVDREAEVDEHWGKLDQLAASRQKTLQECLARETRKEELRVDFADGAGDVITYCADQISLIGEPEGQKLTFGSILQEVEAFDATLSAQDADVDGQVVAKRAAVDKVVHEMADLVKETERFDAAQAAATAEGEADGGDGAGAAVTGDDGKKGSDTPKTARKKKFGTLSKSLRKAFGKSKRKRTHLAKLQEAEKISAAAGDIDWPEASNPYTKLSVALLRTKKEELDAAQAARRAVYTSELARWRENDALCKAFSEFVLPMHTACKQMMEKMGDIAVAEEEQLAGVDAALSKLQDICFKLPEGSKMAAELEARGVTLNPHTVVTMGVVQCELESVQSIAEQKKPHLEAMIKYKQYKGISPEQYAETETIFNDYDTDGSKSISAPELQKCLYAMGEERTKKEIAEFMKKYAKGRKALKFEEFRELMIVLIGDMGTHDGLIESFRVISSGREAILLDDLGELLVPDDVAFFEKEAVEAQEDEATGVKPEGKDFNKWVAAVCAR